MLTPLDIENREFKRTMGGYNRDDVEDFMGLVLNDYEKLFSQNLVLKERNKAIENELEQLKSQTETIQNAFLSAQSTADTIVKNAQDQAKMLVNDAQEKANKIITEANFEIDKLNNCYCESRNRLTEYKEFVERFLKEQMDVIDGLIAPNKEVKEAEAAQEVIDEEVVEADETEDTESEEN